MQPEARISSAIRRMVIERGGFAFKVWGNAQMMAGLPDLVCCYRGVFVAFETKTPTGTTSAIQRHVIARIDRAQGVVRVPRSVADASDVLDRIDTWIALHGDLVDDMRAFLQ